ncbi:hypothetical protein RND71_020795 [Anisodus tanguticus]|uniref:Uncharacterized protein n=1 Tax=Anisodus tanguticus TaxID=243964 RepID=A0AAE1RX33_9SOLA|nr:hypothetical protein RND71_020795 [Anisodus tanguticus]
MAILYAVVARGTTVLSEFSPVAGNTGAVTRRILEKLPGETESRLCFSQDRYIFHILRSDGITFLCMANDTFGRRIPFSYLEDIQMRFMKNYGKVASYAPAYAMNDEFSRVLHQQMEFFSSNPSADTLTRVRGEVDKEFLHSGMVLIPSSPLRTIMVDNIEKILERGDRIELHVDKTATMQDSAFHFRKQSKRLRRALWMKNAKLLMEGGKRLLGSHGRMEMKHQYRMAGGLVDMSVRTLSLLDNRCLLWRHHSTFLQIVTSDVWKFCCSLHEVIVESVCELWANPGDSMIRELNHEKETQAASLST